MSLVWVICGAGRGVGKTTLALNLQRVLPASVYAKCGCGPAKAEKPPRFFGDLDKLSRYVVQARASNDHVIVESNAFAKAGAGDVTLFIDGKPDSSEPARPDRSQLRRCADIVICHGAGTSQWMDVLSERLSKPLAKSFLQVLLGQQQHLFGPQPEAGCKLWFEAGGQHVFGKGLARLFARIDELGTLQKAAKTEGMSYRYAWEMVRKAERHLGKTLLIRRVGGRGGGDSQLSPDGRLLLKAYLQLSQEVSTFVEERFAELYKPGDTGPRPAGPGLDQDEPT